MGTLGSITWPHQALTTMLPSSPATPAPTDMEPDMALRPTMPDTQEPAPTGMGILATVVLTDMELAMVVRTELAMLGMELAMAMAILATPATAPSLRTVLMVMELAIPYAGYGSLAAYGGAYAGRGYGSAYARYAGY